MALEFDPVLHQPARLKVAMLLAATPIGTFNALARDAALTPGNLSAHLKALEAAGYVESVRGFVELKPRVRYRLTPDGRAALQRYCRVLERFVEEARAALASGHGEERRG